MEVVDGSSFDRGKKRIVGRAALKLRLEEIV